MNKPRYFSFTQMDMMSRCEEQWRRRYVCNDRIPPGIALIKGTAVHKGSEENFRQKIKSFKDLSASKIKEVVATNFEERIKNEGLFLNEEEEARGKDVVVAEGKDSAVALAGVFANEVAPAHQPIMCEASQNINLGEYADRELMVKIDLVNDKKRIVDLKTASKSKTQDEVDSSLQFDTYGLAYFAINKEMPAGFDMEVLVNTKVPKRQTLTTTRCQKDFKPLLARFAAFLERAKHIEKGGMAYPTSPGTWQCSKKFCGFFVTCPYQRS